MNDKQNIHLIYRLLNLLNALSIKGATAVIMESDFTDSIALYEKRIHGMAKMTRKEIDEIDEVIVKTLEAEGHVFNYGWSYEDCQLVLSYYTNNQTRRLKTMLNEYHHMYTDEYRRAVSEEIENRDLEEHLLGIKR